MRSDNRFPQEKTLLKNVKYQFPQLTLHLEILKTSHNNDYDTDYESNYEEEQGFDLTM